MADDKIQWDIDFPGISFYEIQKQIILDDKKVGGIFLGVGVGKTLPALCLAEGRILVICPKQQMLDRTWQKDNEKFHLGKDLTVINYDMFWRYPEKWAPHDTVILDEGHRALGVSPDMRQLNKALIPKTSKTFDGILSYLRKFPPKRFYICTATPKSKPMNVWAAAKLFGKNWDYYKFRETFYFPIRAGMRHTWMPRKDEQLQQRLALCVQKMGYTGGLNDFMDVPEQTILTPPDGVHYMELTDEQRAALKELSIKEADPMVRRSKMRTIENGVLYGKKVEKVSDKEDRMVKDTKLFKSSKIEYILERAEEFPKLFVFAAYTAQVHAIADALRAEGYEVKTVTSATKDRDSVFVDMERAQKGILVVASQICEGYRVPSAPCMIFASKSNRFLHYSQALGRIMDGQHLKKNLYIHLVIKGSADEDCHNSIIAGQDFQELLSVL